MLIAAFRFIGIAAFTLSFGTAEWRHTGFLVEGDLIKICTSTGFYFISKTELLGEQEDNNPEPSPTACHALCTSDRQKGLPKSLKQK